MCKNILSPSILSADFKVLGEQIRETEKAGAQFLHFDVMDGKFVPSISFGMPVLKSIQDASSQVKDVHLMIDEPIRYVKEFAESGADIITFHIEATDKPGETIDEIKKYNCKAGVTLKPKTPVFEILDYIDKVDMILVMSVEPGFGGQKFIPESLDKIRAIRKAADEKGKPDFLIEVDGGINIENVKTVIEAGANVIVSGSQIFKGDIYKNTKNFLDIMS